MLSPPKPLDQVKPNLVCELLKWMGRAAARKMTPPPRVGSKGQISFYFNYKVDFKDFFIPNFVCVLTNERSKIYQTGVLFCRLGHALGVAPSGCIGVKNEIPSIQPLCYLFLNHLMKSNQVWCVGYLQMGCVTVKKLAPLHRALGRGQKVQYY